MEVRTCAKCHQIYTVSPFVAKKSTCPNCMRHLDAKFKEVRHYIRKNKDATVMDVSEACDVSIEQIQQWIREERIEYTESLKMTIECERCGAMIKKGYLCDNCQKETATNVKKIQNILESEKVKNEQINANRGKMHYNESDK